MPFVSLRWRGAVPWALGALATAALAQATHDHPPAAPAAPPAPASVPSTHPDAAADAAAAWRAANEAVGAFPRGHADIVRWERAHLPPSAPDASSTPATATASQWTLDDIRRLALRQRADLLIPPGLGVVERLQREQAAAEAVLQAQAAWIEAIAARAQRRLREEGHHAAESGAELAARMQRVGNFSAERALREATVAHATAAALEQARLAERQALVRLWQTVGGAAAPEAVSDHLPRALPALPPLPGDEARPTLAAQQRAHHPQWPAVQAEAERARAALPPGAWEALQRAVDAAVARGAPLAPRLDPTQPRWPHGWEAALHAQQAFERLQRQLDGDLTLALAAARHAAQQAQLQRTVRLPAAQRLEEETLLRYNGMLVGTWELLAAARERLAAQEATVAAERDAWLAWLDLQTVLAGLPYRGRTASATPDAPDTAAKGH
ncbi:hypothetical protein LCC91_09325 [Tepidimonas taiwanensis]|uniref:hypothetical protein n=1 Tax=Tepidimonas taiwanensis TaxID=307486 RepID=UPI001CCE5BB4|nr:hypothetical protein [Tepidimonas taiwanensis]UBQ04763.1 hypothetical protein LCC91_09325 [Tepidimonas taiwanensis]